VLAEPLVPTVAARRARVEIDLELVRRAFAEITAAHEVTIVEGLGGLLAPLAPRYRVADLAAELGLPLVIVARPGLGTINHTLLTVEAALARGLKVAGVIINDYDAETAGLAEETNPEEIRRETGLPILTIVPHDPETDPRAPSLGPAVIEACAPSCTPTGRNRPGRSWTLRCPRGDGAQAACMLVLPQRLADKHGNG
jgi:dethiobiotin synthetase